MSESRDAIAFRELCIRWLDGSLATDEAVQLERVLLDDPSAVDEFLCAADLHAELHIRGAGERAAWQSPSRLACPTDASRATARGIGITRAALIAAALVLAAATIAMYVFVIDRPAEQPTTQSQNAIATLIELTGTLLVNDDLANEGSDYTSGTYSLDHGTAEFMLTNAVNVKLRGKTSMVMHNDLNVSLAHGSAEFVVPHGAKGFTVHLPNRSKIVDLGTAFRIDIDDADDALLRVDEGRVRWDPADPQATAVELEAGRFARIIDGRCIVLPVAFALEGDAWPATLAPLDADAIYANGAVRLAPSNIPGSNIPNTTIIRTLRSDYHRHDWTATFVFTVAPEADGNSPAYIGIGPGEIDHDQYHTPVARPNVLVNMRSDKGRIHLFDNTDTPILEDNPRGRIVYEFGQRGLAGTHRITMKWNATTQVASFLYDRKNDGRVDAEFKVNARDNGFNDDTARIFFGSQGATLTLNRFEITTPDPSVGPGSRPSSVIRTAD